MSELALRWQTRLAAQGVEQWQQVTAAHCSDFVNAATRAGSAPLIHTQHARRTMIRTVLRSLRAAGVDVGDPTLDLQLPARPGTGTRPLTDAEVLLVRATAEMSPRHPRRAVILALAEATAVSSEISCIRWADLDEDNTPLFVRLPGTSRHRPRSGRLTRWGARVVGRHVARLRAAGAGRDMLLTYSGAGVPGQHVAQASTVNALGELLTAAGITDDAAVRPGSVRAWAGRSAFDAGAPIHEVASLLGFTSLDAAAAAIGWRWHE